MNFLFGHFLQRLTPLSKQCIFPTLLIPRIINYVKLLTRKYDLFHPA